MHFVKEFLYEVFRLYENIGVEDSSQSLLRLGTNRAVIYIWDHAHSLLGSSRMTVCTGPPTSSGKQEQISGEILLSFSEEEKNIHFLFFHHSQIFPGCRHPPTSTIKTEENSINQDF